MTSHEQVMGGWYCHSHNATFEPQEAELNNEKCPWCGTVLP